MGGDPIFSSGVFQRGPKCARAVITFSDLVPGFSVYELRELTLRVCLLSLFEVGDGGAFLRSSVHGEHAKSLAGLSVGR